MVSYCWTLNLSHWWRGCLQLLFLHPVRALTLRSNTADLGVGRFIFIRDYCLFEGRSRWSCLFRRGIRLVSLGIQDWLEANELRFLQGLYGNTVIGCVHYINEFLVLVHD